MTELLRLSGRVSELVAGLAVRRVLPAAARRAVGPFIFFDHFGPVTLPADVDSDVGGHPHIGLATVTYLFEGRMLHRDSLGSVQTIVPGAINWMTAGRGIVHSERVTDEERGKARRLHGLQLWVALPPALQAMDPAFQHVPAADLPKLAPSDGVQLRVLVGEALGARSPVLAQSPMLYLDVQLAAGAAWALPALAVEMAVYSPEHAFFMDDQSVPAQQMVVLCPNAATRLRAGPQGLRLMVIGGAPLQQPVRMWWNFVATDRSRIADAARLWAEDGFAPIPGESTRIAAPPWRD